MGWESHHSRSTHPRHLGQHSANLSPATPMCLLSSPDSDLFLSAQGAGFNRPYTLNNYDWGKGPVVTFSHGWPLNSDAWDGQLLFLAQNGFRVVAHDRRGHGRSSQAWSGNDMNGYADDLAAVIEALDLKDVTLVGHSTGGGEVARYIGRHGTKRVAAAVLIGAVPPVMVKSAANPDGIPIEVFDGLRSGVAKDRSQFWKDFAIMFYGANRPGAKVSQGML